MQQTLKTLAVILCLTTGQACLSAEDDLKQQREQFLQARKALKEWRMEDFKRLSGTLKEYPLYSYLEFARLRKFIRTTDNQVIAAFIEQHEGQPVSRRLRQSWLYALARRKDWARFLEESEGTQPVELQCYRLQAELSTSITKTFVDDAIKLWLVGKSQEDACNPAFKYLYDHGHITSKLLWQRIRLAMKNHKTGLAGYLARRLSSNGKAWVDLWKEAHRFPARTLQSPRLEPDTAITRDIILHALRRIAANDARHARLVWKALKPRYRFTESAAAYLEKNIALQANWQKLPEALDWLIAVPEIAVTNSVRDWRVRVAIRNRDWNAVVEQIEALPASEAKREEWRYWKVTALEKTGQEEQASAGWYALAQKRDYHGFLAADRLNKPYRMYHRPLDYGPEILQELASRDGFIRARELFRAKLHTDARREWANAIRNLSRNELKAASALAQQWGWHDRAILTVAKTQDYRDLQLRFPIDREAYIKNQANRHRLDPGHIYAVIRQESAFGETALSPAGARGLMQLMPKTGRDTARKYHIPLAGISELYEPEKNILLGSTYLGEVMKQYNGNIILASAAYNAGPHNVLRWLPQQQKQAPDNWIATITYRETRTYIQRILAYMAIYDWRMKRPITPLKKHMPDIYPESHYPEIETDSRP